MSDSSNIVRSVLRDVSVSQTAPDLTGAPYTQVLERFHQVLRPKTYFEIGTQGGHTLAIARCASISIDPKYQIRSPELMHRICNKPATMLFETTSDDFFQCYNPINLLGRPIDLAFLDGMHRCEFLLRDFIHTERYCKSNSVVFLHDCVPLDVEMTDRIQNRTPASTPSRQGWWTGDVWRTALALKRHRPALKMTVLDARETGLVILTNLDPNYSYERWHYSELVTEMLSWNLGDIGVQRLYGEFDIRPTSVFEEDEQITAGFWL